MKKTLIHSLIFTILVSVSAFAQSPVQYEKELKETLASDPNDYSATVELGILYWDQKKKSPAIRQFRKAIKLYPEGPVPYFYLGEAYYLERKPEKAANQFDLFEEKMDLMKDMDEEMTDYYVDKLNRMGYLYTAMQNEKKAAGCFRKMIKLKPDEPKGHYNLAVCYYQYYNNRPKAYKELKKVMELAPKTRIGDKAEFYIDYMRRNPDSRIIGDFTFMDKD